MKETQVQSRVRKIHWRRKWLLIPLFLPGVPWEIPWTEEPGRLQSMVSQRVEHDWVSEHNSVGLPKPCLQRTLYLSTHDNLRSYLECHALESQYILFTKNISISNKQFSFSIFYLSVLRDTYHSILFHSYFFLRTKTILGTSSKNKLNIEKGCLQSH